MAMYIQVAQIKVDIKVKKVKELKKLFTLCVTIKGINFVIKTDGYTTKTLQPCNAPSASLISQKGGPYIY